MDRIDKTRLSKLISDAADKDNEFAVRTLLEVIDKVDSEVLKEASADFGALCEAWEDEVTRSEDKAEFCVRLAELALVDTPAFRGSLHAAIRKLLPPYLTSGVVVKAIGAKDENVSVHDAALRLRKLQHLRSTALVYRQDTHDWCTIHGIDNLTGSIAISKINKIGDKAISSVSIVNAIFYLQFFNTTPEMLNLLAPGKLNCRSSAEYRKVFRETSLSELHDQKLHDIIMHLMVPSVKSPAEFEAWWNADAAAAKAPVRSFCDARSILELYTLLQLDRKEEDRTLGIRIAEDEAQKLKKFFGNLRKDIQPKDLAMLAECVAALAEAAPAEFLADMIAPLRGKARFFPASVTQETPLADLEQWGRLAVKPLAGFVKAASTLYPVEELAQLGALLPQKCIAVVFALVPDDVIRSVIVAQKTLSCDLILWICKNKSQPGFSRIAQTIDMAKCISALSIEGLSKEWAAAQRDLKKAVFTRADFQRYIIENADGDIPSVIAALQHYRKFQPGERQTILVKLANASSEMKDYIESGAGRKLMGTEENVSVETAPITSNASRKRLADELQDILERQIPANNAAYALAKSFGDLRENAEFDAAKENRRRIHGRRAELERILGFLQGTDFKDAAVQDHAVVGSAVTLAPAAGGADQVYYLLGAYDGNPDRNHVSYQSGIGKAIINRKTGETVTLPGKGDFIVKSVRPLPEDLRKELALEA